MPYKTTADMTKKLLADSLKWEMSKKPLNKVRISDIVNDSKLNRQTFYYHFQDIYALLEWLLEQEVTQLMQQNSYLLTWQDAAMNLMNYVLDNKDFCLCMVNSLSIELLEQFFYTDIENIFISLISELDSDQIVDDKTRNFIAHFYSIAISGSLVYWMKHGMKESPNELLELLTITIYGNLECAIQRVIK